MLSQYLPLWTINWNNIEKISRWLTLLKLYRIGKVFPSSVYSEETHKKRPYWEFFLSVFSLIWTEYGDLQSKSPYSVRMWENMDQKNSEHGHFLRSVMILEGPVRINAVTLLIYKLWTECLKSDSHLPKKFVLFASMIALQKWWKMLFIPS